MIGKKINQLATELAPVSTDLTIIGDPDSGVSKKITLAQLGAIFSGAVSFYTNLAAFPTPGTTDVIYCAKDTQKLYLWSGSAYVEVFPSQALLDTYQLRSEKGNANGYASLDSGGKVPISQLPSSIMEYKGTWNASTNTPTLANGTGDTGDVYICNVAGTVNFGAGPITFAVGDYVIYSGTIWQRSSGAVGTVTSVALTVGGDAISVSGSPLTTSGTLALAFSGTTSQYINGAGNLITFPTSLISGSGASGQVTFFNGANSVTGTNNFFWDATNNRLGIGTTTPQRSIEIYNTTADNHLRLSGNAPSVSMGEAVTGSIYQAKFGLVTTNGQFVSAGVAGDFVIISQTGATIIGTSSTEKMRVNTSGNVSINNTNDTYKLDVNGTVRFTGQLRLESTITDGTNTYTLPSATGTLALTSDIPSVTGYVPYTGATANLDLGTHTLLAKNLVINHSSGSGVAASITKGGSGEALTVVKSSGSGNAASITGGVTLLSELHLTTDLADAYIASATNWNTAYSLRITSATSPLSITSNVISIAQASGSTNGYLSSTDWTTFNNKQSALTNPVTGTGTTNYLPKFTGASTIGNSQIFDNGTNVGIGTASVSGTYEKLAVAGGISIKDNTNAKFEIGRYNTTGAQNSYIKLGANSNSLRITNNTDVADILELTNSGNLGLGVTPSAWGSTFKAFQFGTTGILSSGGGVSNFGHNYYFDGANAIYLTSANASLYQQSTGEHKWLTAPSGTAGNAISFTQAMTLTSAGELCVGRTSAYGAGFLVNVEGNIYASAAIVAGSTITAASNITITNSARPYFVALTTNANEEAGIKIQQSTVSDWYIGTAQGSPSAQDLAIRDVKNGRIPLYFAASTGAATFSGNLNVTVANTPEVFLTHSNTSRTFLMAVDGSNAFFRANSTNNILFQVAGGTNVMALTSGGNVGIGTTSTLNKLDVRISSATTYTSTSVGNILTLYNTSATTNSYSGIDLVAEPNSGSAARAAINLIAIGDGIGDLAFSTRNSTMGERMRITSGGSLLVGTTSSTGIATGSSVNVGITLGGGVIASQVNNNSNQYWSKASGYTSGDFTAHFVNNTYVGGISTNGSTTTYAIASDYRLKTDLKEFNGLDILNKIKTYDYEWKSDGSRMYGVIAHELQSIINYAVTGVKDGDRMQGVDYSKIVPVLIKAIQELNDKIK
jgi:hypothetical protein